MHGDYRTLQSLDIPIFSSRHGLLYRLSGEFLLWLPLFRATVSSTTHTNSLNPTVRANPQ